MVKPHFLINFDRLTKKKLMNTIQARTVVTFLQMKGWEVIHNEEMWSINCKAPNELGLTINQVLQIPLNRYQEAPFFKESMDVVLQIISLVYGKPTTFYRQLFSYNIEQFNQTIINEEAISKDAMALIELHQ